MRWVSINHMNSRAHTLKIAKIFIFEWQQVKQKNVNKMIHTYSKCLNKCTAKRTQYIGCAWLKCVISESLILVRRMLCCSTGWQRRFACSFHFIWTSIVNNVHVFYSERYTREKKNHFKIKPKTFQSNAKLTFPSFSHYR